LVDVTHDEQTKVVRYQYGIPAGSNKYLPGMQFAEDCYCEAPRRKAKKEVHGDHLALFGLRLRWLASRLHGVGNESREAPKGGSVRLNDG
jgi:hypothetical protein